MFGSLFWTLFWPSSNPYLPVRISDFTRAQLHALLELLLYSKTSPDQKYCILQKPKYKWDQSIVSLIFIRAGKICQHFTLIFTSKQIWIISLPTTTNNLISQIPRYMVSKFHVALCHILCNNFMFYTYIMSCITLF